MSDKGPIKKMISTVAIIATLILVLDGLRPCSAQGCFEGASWPKLVGYGTSDSTIIEIDRRRQDGMLAMAMHTNEAEFVGQAGPSNSTFSFMAMDPDSETYTWFKVVQQAQTDF